MNNNNNNNSEKFTTLIIDSFVVHPDNSAVLITKYNDDFSVSSNKRFYNVTNSSYCRISKLVHKLTNISGNVSANMVSVGWTYRNYNYNKQDSLKKEQEY